jgi:hypothetical protein
MNNKFSWQSFISIVLLFSFIMMLFSGIVLYVAPEGSISRWIAWDVLNLSKKQWEHQHTIFSYVFILFSLFHIFKINWALLLSYFTPEKVKIYNFKESLLALSLLVIIFIGTLFDGIPFRYIIDLGDKLSDSHSKNIDMPNSIDSEKLSLNEFVNIILEADYESVKLILDKLNFKSIEKNIVVKDFCRNNKISPEEFYKILKGELFKMDSSQMLGFPEISSAAGYCDKISSIL